MQQSTRGQAQLGSPLAAIEGIYGRAMITGRDFELHDQFAYALISLAAQWDDVIGQHELGDPENQSTVWDAAWHAACHPFVVTFGDGWTSLISVPTLPMAWKRAEEEAKSYGCNVTRVTCTRRCWHCLTADAAYDAKAREHIQAQMADHLGAAIDPTVPEGLRATVRIAHGPAEGCLSDSSVRPGYLADVEQAGQQ